jgi:hypothetical protein
MFGLCGRVLLNLYSWLRKTRLDKAKQSSTLSNLGLPLFLGSFGLISKGSLCALRWGNGKDSPLHGLVSGKLQSAMMVTFQ